ncbi:MAG: response regulator [Chloroflexota bacterium]
MTKNHPTILYIEDNHDNRKLVNRVLSAAGFDVIGVCDGFAGLDYVQTQIPDLILIDLQLPQLDGYAVTTKLREFHQLKETPIVALTANVLKEDRERSFKAGCNGFINKPINVDLLPQQVESYLSGDFHSHNE